MNGILTYAFQTVVCSGLFVVFYRAVLQGRTSFRTARIYLLVQSVVAAVIPALDIPLWRVAPIEIPFVTSVVDVAALSVSEPVAAIPVDRAAIVLWALWGVGLALLGVVMVRQIVRIAAIRRRSEIHPADGFRVAVSGEVGPPFSFLDTVFIGLETPPGEIRQIVMHEASHIRHRHSAEKLAMEVAKNLQWFNPFAWWASRLLAEVHEFEADRDVLDGGSSVEEYLPLILRQTFGYIPELSVGLGDSLTKKRFLMMKNMIKPARNSWLRVAGALPLAAGAMLLFSFKSRPPEIIFTEIPEPVAVAPVPDEPERPVFEATVVRDNDDQALDVVGRWGVTDIVEVVRNDSIQVVRAPQEVDADTPILIAEVMPKFEGGDQLTFRSWVTERVMYPREASEKNITGTVTAKFVIERDGSLSNIEVLSSPDKSLSDETVRVLGLSPKWTPGSHRGRPVRVYYVIPIQFSLEGNAPPAPPAPPVPPAPPAPPVPPAPPTIDEIVVVGYGTLSRQYAEEASRRVEEITRSAEEVTRSAEEASRRADSIKLPRLTIRSADSQPLIVLDGEEITDLSLIDPSKIHSVSVLKDESATAVYGERGKNGVIIITLK